MGFNKVVLLGNLGGDPELREVKLGEGKNAETVNVASFSLAVNQKRGKSETVDWFRVTCWRGLAEVVGEHLKKGRQVLVEGSVTLNVYEKKDGSTGASMEVQAQNVAFVSDGKGEQREESKKSAKGGERTKK